MGHGRAWWCVWCEHVLGLKVIRVARSERTGQFSGAMEGQGKVQRASATDAAVGVHRTARHHHSITADGESSALHTQEHHRSFIVRWKDIVASLVASRRTHRSCCV